jgi:hypothetical protein
MRELIGLSTADLAKYLNKNIATLQYWENPSPSARRYHPSARAWKFLEMMRVQQVNQIKNHLETHLASLDYDEIRRKQQSTSLHVNTATPQYRLSYDRDPLMMTISDILGKMTGRSSHAMHRNHDASQLNKSTDASDASANSASTQCRRIIIHYRHDNSTASAADAIGFNQQALAIALTLAAQGQHVRFEYVK